MSSIQAQPNVENTLLILIQKLLSVAPPVSVCVSAGLTSLLSSDHSLVPGLERQKKNRSDSGLDESDLTSQCTYTPVDLGIILAEHLLQANQRGPVNSQDALAIINWVKRCLVSCRDDIRSLAYSLDLLSVASISV